MSKEVHRNEFPTLTDFELGLLDDKDWPLAAVPSVAFLSKMGIPGKLIVYQHLQLTVTRGVCYCKGFPVESFFFVRALFI